MKPLFPVVVIYEAGLSYCNSEPELQESTLGIFGPMILEDEIILDSSGQSWVPLVKEKPSFNLGKFFRVIRGHIEQVNVMYEFERKKKISLQEFKALILEYSSSDNGDLMQHGKA